MSCLDRASHIDSLLREPPDPGPPDAQSASAHLYLRVVHWCVSMYAMGRVRERWGVSAFSLQGPPPARSAPPDPTTALQVPVRICASVIPDGPPRPLQTLRVRACVYTCVKEERDKERGRREREKEDVICGSQQIITPPPHHATPRTHIVGCTAP